MKDAMRNLIRAAMVALGMLYIVMGVGLFAYPIGLLGLPSGVRYPLGILLIIYGCFRVFRAAKARRFGDA
jgi:uncharacterized membrane protein HdeD (DUF308 family)